MNIYRAGAVLVAACLAGISLTACQGGIGTPAASSSSPPASSNSSSPPPSAPATGASGSPSSPAGGTGSGGTGSEGTGTGSSVNEGGSIGSFPLPPGSSLAENVTSGSTIDIVLSGVTATEVSSFYGSALPAAGYTITANTNATGANINGTAIEFTGHGYKGDIGAATSLGISNLGSILGGDIIGITLTPQ
jgi:hypothetical protein